MGFTWFYLCNEGCHEGSWFMKVVSEDGLGRCWERNQIHLNGVKAPVASQRSGMIISPEIRFVELHQRATEGNIPNICKSFLFERKDILSNKTSPVQNLDDIRKNTAM